MEEEMKNMVNRICKRIGGFLSVRNMSWAGLGIFILSMLPVVYLSFVNRASGDDYGYGTFTRAAWVASGSFWEVLKAAARTVEHYYYGWQGTWFSIFIFSLQPEVFSEKAYVIVAFIVLFCWIGSTVLLAQEILKNSFQLDKSSRRLIIVLFLILNIHFIPNPKSSIFWFNGCAHYMLPFTMCQVLAYWLLRFTTKYQWKYYVGICLFMILLGGSNYQAALFSLIIAVYLGAADFFQKKNKRVFLLALPLIAESIGLIISMKAPGNKVRGGEDFGLSLERGVETIALSFAEGMKNVGGYLKNKPLVFVGLLVLFLIIWETMKKGNPQKKIPHPVWTAGALFCLYSAMQAPAIYAGVEVSNGVYNTNYQVFLLMAVGFVLLLAQGAAGHWLKSWTAEKLHNYLVLPTLFVCLILAVMFRSNVKETTFWKSVDYIATGQAADYRWQMDLQTKLLLDENNADVILPFINDQQGPLMQMPATANPDAWTNTVMRQFYQKNSVVAMPRKEWEALMQ